MTSIIVGATLIDGTGAAPVQDSAVVIEGSRIKDVLSGSSLRDRADLESAERTDAQGRWLMPGLINMHEHMIFRDLIGNPKLTMADHQSRLALNAVRNAVTALRRGWTTVRDMGSSHGVSLAFQRYIAEGSLQGPRVIACGKPICVTGGHANAICIEADGPYEMRKAARSQLNAGADFLKVMASHDPIQIDGPEKTRAEMAPDEIQAVYDEARAHGKRTACHVMGTVAIGRVLDAGVNVISHGFYLNRELAQRMAEQNVYLDPTLSSYGRQTINPRLKRGDAWTAEHMPLIPAMESAFRNAVEAKVKIVTGTDSAGRYAEDVEMMREFGLPAMDSLLACTSHAAEALGLSDELGTVEAGKTADLVILDGDPLADPRNLERVHAVVQSGVIRKPAEITIEAIVNAEIW